MTVVVRDELLEHTKTAKALCETIKTPQDFSPNGLAAQIQAVKTELEYIERKLIAIA